MSREEIQITAENTKFTTTLFYCQKHGTGHFYYLQAVRSQQDKPELRDIVQQMETTYTNMLAFSSKKLAAQVDGSVDALVSPPSSFPNLIDPWRAALQEKFPMAEDLTSQFSRTENVRSSLGPTFLALLNNLSYNRNDKEAAYKSILIVDDILASGRTVGTVIQRLREFGTPPDCQFRVVAPLWLPPAAENAVA